MKRVLLLFLAGWFCFSSTWAGSFELAYLQIAGMTCAF
jgi:hypothetical protein